MVKVDRLKMSKKKFATKKDVSNNYFNSFTCCVLQYRHVPSTLDCVVFLVGHINACSTHSSLMSLSLSLPSI